MANLIKEPRLIKQSDGPKKKQIKKYASTSVTNWKLLSERNKEEVEKLQKLYNEDRLRARVYYYSNHGRFTFHRHRLFEYEDNNFEMCTFEVSMGISKTNKKYTSQKKMGGISYKNGKFWYTEVLKSGRRIRALNYHTLTIYISSIQMGNDYSMLSDLMGYF